MTRIGIIGVGAMGEPMAHHLLRKGHAVTTMRSRRPQVAERLREEGARLVATPAEVAAACEVLLLVLPTSGEVQSVLFGTDGAAARLEAGALVIDCTTGNPPDTAHFAAALREKRIALVAAGMTRGVAGAKQGKLAFFVGGEAPGDLERAKAVLRATGDTFVEFPSAAQAHQAKLISNVLSYATVALVNEAMMLGARGGLELATLHRALMEGAPSKALEAFGPRIVAREYDPPRVTVDHACDDLELARALAAGAESGLAMLTAAQDVYRAASALGHGERDVSILGETWRAGARA